MLLKGDIMAENIKILKIIGEVSQENSSKIIEDVKSISGVLDCVIEELDGLAILKYAIDEWSSDYDILVKIMNLLTDNYDLDSEMYDIAEESDEEEYIIIDESDENESYEEDDESTSHCQGCHEHGNEKNERKFKLIELGVSVLFLIVGLILNSIDKTKDFSKYLFVLSYAAAGYEILFDGFVKVVKGKIFNENLLMSIASLSAIVLGQFVESAGIMLLFSLGELFEHTASDNAKKVIDRLKDFSQKTVSVINENGEVIVKNPEEVEACEVILIKAGERVVIDGEIIEGSSSFDTKTITGESNYKDAKVGDVVYGGFVSVNGSVKVKALKTYNESTIKNIVDIVEESAAKKSKNEKFIEKFAKVYTPIVVIFALALAFIPPIFSGVYLEGLKVWGLRGIMLLCISCPCSLVISIPLTYFCGVGSAAKKGILVKDSASLEKLSKCKTIVFDKTGTLTEGNLKLTKIISTKDFNGKVLNYARIAEQYSNHPIAKAVLSANNNEIPSGENFVEIAGKGVTVEYKGDKIACGNKGFIEELGVKVIENSEVGAKLYVAVNDAYAGCIIFNDTIKKMAYGAILELYDAGIEKTVMLTGDNKDYAVKVRKELSIKQSVSELLPQDKVKEIERLIEENKKSTVAFVGDGVNDAPSITRADVGFAMGALGSDSAIDSSDIVIVDDDLSKIPYTVKLAKRTNSIAKQNIIASLAVKGLVLLLGATGVYTSLWLAISADVGMLVLTVLNAIRNRNKVI